ncbi:aminoglycoside phosphotransferase family protein [Dactylosporangium fulvum]|uniref:Aminoglycoside phosphotransferase family protein n=1 Tax=Dactylosporangium fulvum TaxID=53359 RepID=A0ABY5VXD5_9ACTN|nr:aminoglycoside phosphotransferase family protein [Dactylosporangium fulvum]UWP81927.1 aminoglycoside phosphotransferase family protein [Dactylosporangium fulvum]
MLTPPRGLPDDALSSLLVREWGLTVKSLTYRAVGFGSHHWELVDTSGSRWFVTVDEPADADKLHASLSVAVDLRATGHTFAVAPIPTVGNQPMLRHGPFAVAVYPFVDGTSFDWNAFAGPEHRQATLDMIIQLHTAPPIVRRHARVDDFAVPHRDEVEQALKQPGPDCGPYSTAVADLLVEHAEPLRRVLARYDELVLGSRAEPVRAVLTHGEPHSGNTMRTPTGWRLIDWDTVLVSPPERDLWLIEPGDGSIFAAYADATGVLVRPSTIMLLQLRWALSDIAVEIRRFRRPHTGTSDDAEGWEILRSVVTRID